MRHFLFISVLLIFIFSCGNTNNSSDDIHNINPVQYEKNLQEANKLIIHSEDMQIDDYISRKGWKMSKSPTGLRYWIYKEGDGEKATKHSIIRFNFKVELINGFVCYDSEHDGFQEIQLGKSVAPSGLEEGLAMMKEGDKAKLILPSHLAYGLLGDQDKIPTKAILIYYIHLLQIRDIY